MIPQWMVEAIREESQSRLGSTLIVWITLCGFADRVGSCYPSKTKIAERAGVSETTVKESLNLLRKVGALTWEQRRAESGDLTSNVYMLHYASPSFGVTDPQEVGLWNAPPPSLERPTPGAVERLVTRTTSNQKKNTSPPTAGDHPGFATWWSAWPRKIAKPDAYRAYVKALEKPGVTDEIILAGLRAQMPMLSKAAKFCPYPATWLNRESWADESATPTKPAYIVPRLPR